MSFVVAKCYVIPDIEVVAGILQGFNKEENIIIIQSIHQGEKF